MSAFLFYQGGENICGIINENRVHGTHRCGGTKQPRHFHKLYFCGKNTENVTISYDNSKFTLQESKNAMSGEQKLAQKMLVYVKCFSYLCNGLMRG